MAASPVREDKGESVSWQTIMEIYRLPCENSFQAIDLHKEDTLGKLHEFYYGMDPECVLTIGDEKFRKREPIFVKLKDIIEMGALSHCGRPEDLISLTVSEKGCITGISLQMPQS